MHITDEQARLIRDCVTEMVLQRQRTGQPIPERVRGLLAYVSTRGHETNTGASSLRHEEPAPISTTEAARILGCTRRTVIRLAADLDGHKTGRDWIFHHHKVTEYAEGKRERT